MSDQTQSSIIAEMSALEVPGHSELEAALRLDEGSLFAQLATYGIDAAPRDPIDRGFRIFSALSTKLHSSICDSAELQQLVANEADQLTLAAALADLLATISHQIPVATVSALFTKLGLHRYCADKWA